MSKSSSLPVMCDGGGDGVEGDTNIPDCQSLSRVASVVTRGNTVHSRMQIIFCNSTSFLRRSSSYSLHTTSRKSFTTFSLSHLILDLLRLAAGEDLVVEKVVLRPPEGRGLLHHLGVPGLHLLGAEVGLGAVPEPSLPPG